MKMNKKGFTLIEMLVVIAIIAVLVSIVIPVVGNSTEKAKEAADAANIRSAIAEVTTKALAGEYEESKIVELSQDGEFEYLGEDAETIAGYDLADFKDADEVEIKYNEEDMVVEVYVGTKKLTLAADKTTTTNPDNSNPNP